MRRLHWTLLVAVLVVVALWTYAFRDGLDPLSALAATICSAGAALFVRDALREPRKRRGRGPAGA